MKLKLALAAVAALFMTAGAAQAKELVTVKLEAPVAKETKLIANGGVFTCVGDSCTGYLRVTADVQGCRQLTKEVGRVVNFGEGQKPLSEGELARCNAVAKAPAAAGPAQTVAQQ
ncbi:MAG: CC_3452 family protein [Caulobacterales bacterium]|jgi:hypothetical protein